MASFCIFGYLLMFMIVLITILFNGIKVVFCNFSVSLFSLNEGLHGGDTCKNWNK